MPKEIPISIPRVLMADDMKENFDRRLDEVEDGRPLILRSQVTESGYQDTAIILPMEEYERLKAAAEEWSLKLMPDTTQVRPTARPSPERDPQAIEAGFVLDVVELLLARYPEIPLDRSVCLLAAQLVPDKLQYQASRPKRSLLVLECDREEDVGNT